MEICIVNSFIISNKIFKRQGSIKAFQLKIARMLLGPRYERIRSFKTNNEGHFPEGISTKWPTPCKVCPKKTSLRCEKCTVEFEKQIPLCARPCFKMFHLDPLKYIGKKNQE